MSETDSNHEQEKLSQCSSNNLTGNNQDWCKRCNRWKMYAVSVTIIAAVAIIVVVVQATWKQNFSTEAHTGNGAQHYEMTNGLGMNISSRVCHRSTCTILDLCFPRPSEPESPCKQDIHVVNSTCYNCANRCLLYDDIKGNSRINCTVDKRQIDCCTLKDMCPCIHGECKCRVVSNLIPDCICKQGWTGEWCNESYTYQCSCFERSKQQDTFEFCSNMDKQCEHFDINSDVENCVCENGYKVNKCPIDPNAQSLVSGQQSIQYLTQTCFIVIFAPVLALSCIRDVFFLDHHQPL